MRAVRVIPVRHALYIRIAFQQGSDTRYLIRSDTFEHHMNIRARHLRGRAKLVRDDLQAAFHLRIIRQVFGHVSIDIRMEHQYTAYHR